jgi:hypothetical protein
MSSSRQAANNRFKNSEARKSLPWHEFRDVLTRFFPRKDLFQPTDTEWARRFFEAINEALLEAGIRERFAKRPQDQRIAARLAEIEKTVWKLRELMTAEQASYKDGQPEIGEISSANSSDLIWYWMTFAIGRDASEFERFVKVLPEIAQAARLGREKLESEKGEEVEIEQGGAEAGEGSERNDPTDVERLSKGRPKDHFKDAFLVAMLPVWEMFAKDRPATFATGPDAEELCPFCSFIEVYFLEAGIGTDTAQAISARCRALSLRRRAEKQ